MNDVKISKDCYVPKGNVKYYISYTSSVIKNDVRRKRKQGLVLDLTGGRKIQTVIYLLNGEVILVNTLFTTIAERMSKCDIRKEAESCLD